MDEIQANSVAKSLYFCRTNGRFLGEDCKVDSSHFLYVAMSQLRGFNACPQRNHCQWQCWHTGQASDFSCAKISLRNLQTWPNPGVQRSILPFCVSVFSISVLPRLPFSPATLISPPSGPSLWLFQGPPAESKLLAVRLTINTV